MTSLKDAIKALMDVLEAAGDEMGSTGDPGIDAALDSLHTHCKNTLDYIEYHRSDDDPRD